MADNSKIEWCDATWNPITGCSVVSPGCINCYAMRLAGTRLRGNPSRIGLTQDSKAGPVWNGQVRFNEQWLDQPLRWYDPRWVFVCAHGDLFHEAVPDEWIDRVFAVMALAPQHTFLVLTKRAKRMRGYIDGEYSTAIGRVWFSTMQLAGGTLKYPVPALEDVSRRITSWPLPNVMLGVSVEDQPRADERRDDLHALAEQRWRTFVSYEPALGPVDWTAWGFLSWAICGGESGPGARPMHPDWARSLRDQCAATGVPYFFKQWGEFAPGAPMRDMIVANGEVRLTNRCAWAAGHGGYRDATTLLKVGKSRAGRLLDGREHSEFPA